MESQTRVPLRDQTNDLGQAKRQRTTTSKIISQHYQQVQAQQQQAKQLKQHEQELQAHLLLKQQQQPIATATQRRRPVLEGEEFKEWQSIWRKTMKESVIYFYGDDGNNPAFKLETEKLKHALKLLGASISPFFDSDVTIIISRKPYDKKKEYRPGHVFHSASLNGLKVWTYEKVFRFLKNLGEPSPQLKPAQPQDLSVLLTQERLHGPIDRDFSLKRDDFHYFKGLYFYCYDLRQVYRPVAVREWTCKNGQDEETAGFPQLYASTNGRCPFQDDPASDNSTKKRLQRMKFFEENKEFRQKLIKASRIKRKRSHNDCDDDSDSEVDDSFYKSSSSSSCLSPDDQRSSSNNLTGNTTITKSNVQRSLMMAAPPAPLQQQPQNQEPQPPVTLSRESSSITPVLRPMSTNTRITNYPISNQNAKFFEIQASGMNNQSTAVSQNQSQQDFGNNGLAPSRAEVLTKSFKNLNRKVTKASKSTSLKEVIDLKRKREELKSHKLNDENNDASQITKKNEQTKQTEKVVLKERKKDEVCTAGYCESCRLKYDDFDQHINSTKHRSFALKDSNFEHIDDLIRKIHDTNILHNIS